MRVNIKAILADPVLRRRMTVNACLFMQHLEGIDTTRKQMEAAYDKVRAENVYYGSTEHRQPALRPPEGCHWAYREGFEAGLKKDRAKRGFMLFGLSCAGDGETVINVRTWVTGFNDAMIAANGGAEAYETWRVEFVELMTRYGITVADDDRTMRNYMVDTWAEHQTPAEAAETSAAISKY